VFFIHVIILEEVWKYFGQNYNFPGLDLLFFITVTGISFAMAFIIHKIPNLYKITG
jgi:hypothetical protein